MKKALLVILVIVAGMYIYSRYQTGKYIVNEYQKQQKGL